MAIARTCETLGRVAVIGAGFVDPYFAIPEGVGISADDGGMERTVVALARAL